MRIKLNVNSVVVVKDSRGETVHFKLFADREATVKLCHRESRNFLRVLDIGAYMLIDTVERTEEIIVTADA